MCVSFPSQDVGAKQAKGRRLGLDDWAMVQTWRQRSEDLRREAETRRLARTLRNGSPGRYRVPARKLSGTAVGFSSPSDKDAPV